MVKGGRESGQKGRLWVWRQKLKRKGQLTQAQHSKVQRARAPEEWSPKVPRAWWGAASADVELGAGESAGKEALSAGHPRSARSPGKHPRGHETDGVGVTRWE